MLQFGLAIHLLPDIVLVLNKLLPWQAYLYPHTYLLNNKRHLTFQRQKNYLSLNHYGLEDQNRMSALIHAYLAFP